LCHSAPLTAIGLRFRSGLNAQATVRHTAGPGRETRLHRGDMKTRFFTAIFASAIIGLAATAEAGAVCSNDDIAGEWTWEVTAHLDTNSVYTFVCPVVIRADRTFKPADCTQVDNRANSPKGSLDVAGRFTVSRGCVVRNQARITLVYNAPPGGGSVTWHLDNFDGWMARDGVAMTGVLSSGPAKTAKVTAFRR
jgi:hypothetical protein